jgi:putative membrane protein insertion efficiency factor
MARLLELVILAYQATLSRVIRLFLGDVCRFTPSCSAYALACVREHGAARGAWLGLRRLGKCHPFHPGGHDPPPARGGAKRA